MKWNITGECVSIVYLALVWVYSHRGSPLPTLKNQLFQWCFGTTFITTLFNILSVIGLQHNATVPLWLNFALATVYFVVLPLMGMVYFYYVVALLYEQHDGFPKKYLLWALPCGLYIAVVLSNGLHGRIFWITQETGYTQGPWILFSFFIFYCYCMAALVATFIHRKKVEPKVLGLLTLFPGAALGLVFVQQLFPAMILTGTVATSALILLYLNLQNKQISIDYLLNVQNRKELLDLVRLQMMRAAEQPFLLVVFSLRDFKSINNNFGQQMGDRLLQSFCRFICSHVNQNQVYRFSGDQLVVYFGENEEDKAQHLCNAMHLRMQQPWEVGNIRTLLPMCTAVITYPLCAKNLEELLMVMEYAITLSKAKKAGGFCQLDLEMLAQRSHRQAVISQMEQCYRDDSFDVFMQPFWSVREQRFTMGESLLRMMDTPMGDLYPSEFIPLAESTGLIVGITYQVLDKVCKNVALAQQRGSRLDHITVNFSALQLNENQLSQAVFRIIENHGISPEKIKIEITESVISENKETVHRFVNAMHEKGIQVGLDDFGTGYSNLVSVMNGPLDYLKIDKSLLWSSFSSPKNRMMLQMMVRVIKEMGLDVVCEGIETEEHARFAADCGCDFLQGYYYARPIPFTDALDLMDSETYRKQKTIEGLGEDSPLAVGIF